MKYFSPSYWFKLWVLSAPLFKDKIKGINAMSIDNKSDIKNWFSNNTNLQSIKQNISFTNLSTNHKPYNLNQQLSNQNINPIYQTELETIVHKHRHEKHRNRFKKALNHENEIRGSWGEVTCSFTPKTFEDIIRYYYKDMDWSYGKRFQFKIKILYNHDDMYDNSDIAISSTFPWTWEEIENIGESFYKNFLNIEKVYTNSSKRERIETKFTYYRKVEFKSVRIITEDMGYYPNNLLDNLERDFPDWNKNIEINLGKINDNVDNEIKSVINKKYPNLKFHCIDIFDKQSSYFLNWDKKTNSFGGFSAKISGNNTDKNCYSYGLTKPTFTYVTQYQLNEISNIIANHTLTKLWIKHINDWKTTTLPVKMNELNVDIQHLKDTYPLVKELDEKINIKKQAFKVDQKETLKRYIRDWSYISSLIEHELKLDELNKNVQGIKTDFETLNKTVNELGERITNLENVSGWNCANELAFSSGALSTIPVIGNIAGGITAMASSACAIAGV